MIFEYIDLRATTRQKNEMFFKTTLEPIMLQPMIKKKEDFFLSKLNHPLGYISCRKKRW